MEGTTLNVAAANIVSIQKTKTNRTKLTTDMMFPFRKFTAISPKRFHCNDDEKGLSTIPDDVVGFLPLLSFVIDINCFSFTMFKKKIEYQ